MIKASRLPYAWVSLSIAIPAGLYISIWDFLNTCIVTKNVFFFNFHVTQFICLFFSQFTFNLGIILVVKHKF